MFTFVSNAMMAGARSLLNGRGLILNASFPRAVLPLVAIVKSVFDFLPTMLVYFVFHAGARPAVRLVARHAAGDHRDPHGDERSVSALLFAPLMVFYRDTGGFLPYVTRIWLYVTPVLYFVREIPPKLLVYLRWNPLYPVVRRARADLQRAAGRRRGTCSRRVGVGRRVLPRSAPIVFLARERDFAVRL